MATTSRYNNPALPDCRPRGQCDPAPVCPACGGLECLCRPRFFAGQLLTEDDLNRLDSYIVAKNRLHNRYLHGWGVACGLEVVCNACDPEGGRGTVIVRPGYALSPCGNDIIVCRESAVNICDLIARCRPKDDMCLPDPQTPGGVPSDNDCGGGTEEWILGVCYTEKPSRGVTALMNAADPAKTSCGCSHGSCGCGGSGSSGCGCGGKKKAKGSNGAKVPPRECEPTVTCESYAFSVWKAPKKNPDKRTWGPAAQRFACCIEPFLSALGQFPQDATQAELMQWYFDLRETIRTFLLDEGLYDCAIAAKLASVMTPQPAGNNVAVNNNAVLDATYAILAIGALILQKCFCAALLPPCPETAETDCVPLATITVKRRPCTVVKVCNLSARKFLITIPTIQYWLSFFTLFTDVSIRDFFEKICCTDLERWMQDYTRTNGATLFARQGNLPMEQPVAKGTKAPLGSMVLRAFMQPGRPVNAATFMLAAMGARDETGQPLASDDELANPADFLLAHQVIAPALRAALPPELQTRGGLSGQIDAFRAGEASGLAGEIEELKRKVSEQQAQIDQLTKRRR
jgi:hypothetical protein